MTNFVTFDCDLSEGKHATLGVRDSYLLAGTRGPGLSSNRSRSQLSDGEWAVRETKRESRSEKIVQTFRDKCEKLREIVNTENKIIEWRARVITVRQDKMRLILCQVTNICVF